MNLCCCKLDMTSYGFKFLLFNIFVVTFYFLSILNTNDDDISTNKFTVYEPQHSTGEVFQYNVSTHNMNDLRQLIDLNDFQFMLNNYPCHKTNFDEISDQSDQNNYEKNIFLLIFIHSSVNNFHKRQVIRETWGSLTNVSHYQIRKVFLVGLTNDPQSQSKLIVENNAHHDIIQGNFIDSYRNMTYKHIMGLKWVSYHCQTAKFILKTDDDIFVDVFQMVPYLRGYMINLQPPKNLISCYLIERPVVKRNPASKWFISYEDYPDTYFPPYCYGWGVIMSPDIVNNLYIESKNATYFWIDDVFVTGILAERLKVQHVDLEPKLALNADNILQWLASDSLSLPPLLGHPEVVENSSTVYSLWNKTKAYHLKI
ncbi:beta-1,3-galactosyltransferase 5-like [Brevipalpus obovatus]|uniref:beta-1,3-galactosyltransferase 5-like n=1 Tax=Brevipalpus obovatus TaxID=246614 RepID=UPI003D9F844C